jgi:hypothetical protein
MLNKSEGNVYQKYFLEMLQDIRYWDDEIKDKYLKW